MKSLKIKEYITMIIILKSKYSEVPTVLIKYTFLQYKIKNKIV